jgi:RNase P protein component
MPLFPQGYDIVIVAKKDVSRFGFHRIKDELGKVICNKTFHAEA